MSKVRKVGGFQGESQEGAPQGQSMGGHCHKGRNPGQLGVRARGTNVSVRKGRWRVNGDHWEAVVGLMGYDARDAACGGKSKEG